MALLMNEILKYLKIKLEVFLKSKKYLLENMLAGVLSESLCLRQ